MKCSKCNSESNRLRYYRNGKERQYLCINCHPKPDGMDKEYKREDYDFICKEKVKWLAQFRI